MDFRHVILTRFSVRAYPDSPRFSTAWLDHRLSLFETYCLPPLARQTCPRFTWLVFCDESTEDWCLARLRRWSEEVGQLRIVVASREDPAYSAAVEQAHAGDLALVTTRVDSDDGSSLDFVERVQAYVPAFLKSMEGVTLLNFSRGFKLREDDATLHETWNPHSAFLTMFERLDHSHTPLTVHSGNHGFMQERYPLQVDGGPPVWLQVLHGGNVSNHVYGTDREVPASALGGRFHFPRRDERPAAVAAAQPEEADGRAAFRQGLEEALLGEERQREPPPGAS